METIHWLATMFGPLLIVRGIWTSVFASRHVKKVAKDHHDAHCGLLGFFNLVLGLLILSLYNHWSMTMPVLITILGWAFVIRAISILFLPHICEVKKANAYKIIGIVLVIWGIAISSIGFSM
ncbi:MAG: hypothetical protein HKM07_04655 [Chlamydiae bacterium]|nr:hypothetical protein [Chlamydiota bacterium]